MRRPSPRARRRVTAILTGLLAAGLVACRDGGPGIYEARGIVRQVEPAHAQLVIEHEDIPGLMPAMTMNFDVADPTLLETLAPGQSIAFRLEFTGRSYRVLEAQVLDEMALPVAPSVASRGPEAFEPAPAFELLDARGGTLSLDDLRGHALLLDFIYTRCPGPCPILTGTHVELYRSLSPELRRRVRFVSISLDPEHDDPGALQRYARARGADVEGWHFLTGSPDRVQRVVDAYGVGSVRAADGSIDHRVVTFLIDAEGRIIHRYLGLEHEPDEIARDLRRLLGASAPAARGETR